MFEPAEWKEFGERLKNIERYLETLFSSKQPAIQGPQPAMGLLKKREAAKALGIGLTKLEGLIRRGELSTRKLGGRELIPHNEITRLSRPDAKTIRHGGRRRSSEYDADLELEKSRELRRKRNKLITP